jgi:GrpB-like predicted nucleotidyltransferase (UPF0157 family)
MDDAQIEAASVGGPPRQYLDVVVADYDPEWPRLFERVAERIRAALGERALQIEHTGSTSVPGLAAKPIIDITLVVEDTTEEAAYVPPLEAAGYVLRTREPDWYEHRMLRGADPTVNLHVFSRGCEEVQRMTAFRDHLRGDAADRELYERTKRDLAGRNWRFGQNYADAKSGVIQEIMARAGSRA